MNKKAVIIPILVTYTALIIYMVLNPANWEILLAAVIISTAILLIWMIRQHAGKTSYVCPDCSHEFKVTPMKDFLSPHTPNTKRLTCPECGKKNWCPVVRLPWEMQGRSPQQPYDWLCQVPTGLRAISSTTLFR